jgi:hypothetical protein
MSQNQEFEYLQKQKTVECVGKGESTPSVPSWPLGCRQRPGGHFQREYDDRAGGV